MTRRLIAPLVAAVAGLLVLATPALATLSTEVSAGQTLASRVQTGQASCTTLTPSDFEHLGEYVMDRMLGSRSVHEVMNARMERMMGEQNADRMHELLGREYAGCATTSGGAGMMSGTGMMGGGGGITGWGAMMSSPNWSWMHGGGWQHMNRGQWQQLGHRMLGGMMLDTTGGGWSPRAVIAIGLSAVLLSAIGIVAWTRRRPPSAPVTMGRPEPRT